MRNQNLQPWEKGTSGNPSGRPKGSRNISTIIRDIMEDTPKWSLVPVDNPLQLEKRYGNKSAWEAVVYVAFARALKGDIKAMNWLSKTGYGDESDGKPQQILYGTPVALVEFTNENEDSIGPSN